MAMKMLANKATRQVQASATKKSGTSKVGGNSSRIGGAGYRKYDGDALWLPNTTRPEWLDGSLPGDRGFDPLGLSRPSEFVLIGVDGQDQNQAQNKKGSVDAVVTASPDQVEAASSLAPYSEVFGLARFRECELIHGRWAMLACLGCLAAEGVSGVNWVEATQAELEKASYLNLELPFSTTTLAYINPILIGGAELYRNSQTDPEKRCYPGGFFDPLKLASEDPERAFNLKTAEIKHARLAMVAALGYGVQIAATGKGALGSLAAFGSSF